MPVAATVASEVGVEVGTMFVCSWGYDQTNVDFYKVVGISPSGKSVKVQKWSEADSGAPSHFTHESVVPGDAPVMVADWSDVTPEMDFWERQQAVKMVPAPVETKRLQHYMSGGVPRVYFSVNSYSSAHVWDGKPEYQTASGFGH